VTEPNFILLYVDNPCFSAEFYVRLLGKEPVESSPTFAMFALQNGVMLGLWSRHTVEPAMNGTPGAGELAFAVKNPQTVRDLYKEWGALKIRIAQAPTELDFGFTFVALDPDGHRLRVFAPNTSEG
jgi:catechol 2,3-dioxygenase-like lactoylglutathione lyase family enzyme